jgi:LCP family protein required for cell wall assembly
MHVADTRARLTRLILAYTLDAVSTGQPTVPAASSKGQRVFIAAAVVIFAAISAYLALVIITRVDSIFFPGNQLTLGRVPGGEAIGVLPGVDDKGTSGSQERINILVVGLDKRPQDGDSPSRTDTIFIVTVDPKTKSTGILGIPRDLWVDIPYSSGSGTYKDRINSVYVAGELNGYDQGGIGLMKDVIEQDFGIEINKYVMVDFDGFESIIDALGGIEVDVPDAVFDPYYSETEKPGDYFPQDFEVGRQHMDGRTALAYSRIRFSSDDLDRIQRQQRVIFATIDKAKSLDVLSKAPDLWDKYKDAITTDISDTQIAGYALLANQVKDDIHAVSLGPATVPCTGPRGEAALCGDEEIIASIVTSLFVDRPGTTPIEEATPDPVNVQVQNATETTGLAARVVSFIASKGYPVDDLNPANVFDEQPHDTTEIIDLDGTHRQNAFLIAKYLDVDPARVRDATPAEREAMSGADAEIVVILGADIDFDTLIQSPTTSTSGG